MAGLLAVQVASGLSVKPDPVVRVYFEYGGLPADSGSALSVDLQVAGPGSASLRVLESATGRTVDRQYWSYDRAKKGFTTLGSSEIEAGVRRESGEALRVPKIKSYQVPLESPGFYEVRLASGGGPWSLQLSQLTAGSFAISFQNGRFLPWRPDLRQAWFKIPANARELIIEGVGVRLADGAGSERLRFPPNGGTQRERIVFTEADRGSLWLLQWADATNSWFRAKGIPVLLSESKDFVDRLDASLVRTEDGLFLPHAFQERAEDWIRRLLLGPLVGDTEALLARLDMVPEGWTAKDLQDRSRLNGSYGLYPHLERALREQNLDADSHWAGTIGQSVWKPREAAQTPEERWDFLRHTPGRDGQGHGGISLDPSGEALAQAFALDLPGNPFYRDPALLYRGAAAALRDLMAINEAGFLDGSGAGLSTYSGFPSFVFGRRHFESFALLAPYLPPELREVWAEGLGLLVDRYWPEGLVSTRNQSSHDLTALQSYAMGTGKPEDAWLARTYARRFIASMDEAGYPPEAGGPCATYAGISHWYLGLYYRLSGDPAALDALARSYRFYNHTVAPEPSGRAYGGFNYTHRVSSGFHSEQYGGARPFVADWLPEVGLWVKESHPPEAETWSPDARSQKPAWPQLAYKAVKYDRDGVARGLDLSAAEDEGSWMREVGVPGGAEFVAVKRPGYYAALYVGQPAGSPFYLYGADDGVEPLPEEVESGGANFYQSTAKTKATKRPMNNGGFTVLQSPEFGNAVLGGTTPFTHHGLVAVRADGVRSVADYFDQSYALDGAAGTLQVTGQMDSVPMEYDRVYQFGDDAIEVNVTLKALGALDPLERLVENIPLMGGSFKEHGTEIRLLDVEGKPVPEIDARSDATAEKVDLKEATGVKTIELIDGNGSGLRITLGEPSAVRVCRSGMISAGGIQHNRVEVVLDTASLEAEAAQLELTYTVSFF